LLLISCGLLESLLYPTCSRCCRPAEQAMVPCTGMPCPYNDKNEALCRHSASWLPFLGSIPQVANGRNFARGGVPRKIKTSIIGDTGTYPAGRLCLFFKHQTPGPRWERPPDPSCPKQTAGGLSTWSCFQSTLSAGFSPLGPLGFYFAHHGRTPRTFRRKGRQNRLKGGPRAFEVSPNGSAVF